MTEDNFLDGLTGNGKRDAAISVSPDLEASASETQADFERQAKLRRKTPAQQRRYHADARRNKITIDLSEQMRTRLRSLADEQSVSLSGLIEFLLVHALRKHDQNDIEFEKYLIHSRSPRFEWMLDIAALMGDIGPDPD